jgi:Transposase IS116/IS110/IS902 family
VGQSDSGRQYQLNCTKPAASLLTHCKLLQSKAIAIDNDLRGTLRNFGLKVGIAGKVKFEARIKELVENFPDLAALVEPLLIVRRVLREQIVILHRRLLAIVRDDEVCRRLMTVPGVGPVVALTYRATIDVPARLRKSKAVGAVFGLTCSKYQSGEINRTGAISRCGDDPGADSEEKREPASDINTCAVDSLKVLDPERPIREADIHPANVERRHRVSVTPATRLYAVRRYTG